MKRDPLMHYIYVDDNEFKGFTNYNLKTLKDTNIQTVSLIFGDEDGSYKEVSLPMSTDKLPTIWKKIFLEIII